MSAIAVVDHACELSRGLVQAEARGPGDVEGAMRRIDARWGIPYSALLALRYRRPKRVEHSLYERLKAAHRAICEAQMRKFQHELERTRAACGPAAPLVRAAVAVAGADEHGDRGRG